MKNLKPHILVTGGAGYIGSITTEALIAAGYEVVILDNLSTGHTESVPSGAQLIEGDVRNKSLVKEILHTHQIDGVIHFAAKTIVTESVLHPLEYFDNNVIGVIRVLEACKETNVSKIIFSSTAAVHGNGNMNPLTETCPIKPLNPYAESKYLAERIIRQIPPSEMQSVILRYFNVAAANVQGTNGPRAKNATHLIKVAAEVALGKRPNISIFGEDYETSDGTPIRDYIHVQDLADIHIRALGYLLKGGPSEIFNCGYGRGHTVKQVIKTMQNVSNANFLTKSENRRPGDSIYLVADNTKVRKALQWSPKFDNLELICKSAYNWEQNL